MNPKFLTLAQVQAIQHDQVIQYGGSFGIRDLGLLESAVETPKASFGGEFLHEDLYSMAAAYLYHIVMNHPFVDGNKRTGLVSAVVFLELNGIEVTADNDEFADLVLSVAEGKTGKEKVAEFLRQNSREAGDM